MKNFKKAMKYVVLFTIGLGIGNLICKKVCKKYTCEPLTTEPMVVEQ
jgi:hypothetical protein